MYYSEFITKYNGKRVDTDGYPPSQPYQCVDLAEKYNAEVVGGARIGGNGADIYGRASSYLYQKIPNTLTSVPKKGDIVCWKGWSGNPYGHVAIATGEGNAFWFYSHDQNWGGAYVHKVFHNYSNVIGYLRPIKPIEAVVTIPNTFLVRVDKTVASVRTAPKVNAPLTGSQYLYRGDIFTAVGVVAGDSVSGNNLWYKSAKGNYIWSGGLTRL